jgi:hypothetical protein
VSKALEAHSPLDAHPTPPEPEHLLRHHAALPEEQVELALSDASDASASIVCNAWRTYLHRSGYIDPSAELDGSHALKTQLDNGITDSSPLSVGRCHDLGTDWSAQISGSGTHLLLVVTLGEQRSCATDVAVLFAEAAVSVHSHCSGPYSMMELPRLCGPQNARVWLSEDAWVLHAAMVVSEDALGLKDEEVEATLLEVQSSASADENGE